MARTRILLGGHHSTPSPNCLLTAKQMILMVVIWKRNPDGSPVDLDEILDRISYETSKESLQFSIRALANRGLIVKLANQKRRGRSRRLVELTPEGKDVMEAGVATPSSRSFLETEEETQAFDAVVALHSAVLS